MGLITLKGPDVRSAFGVHVLHLAPDFLSLTLIGHMGIKMGTVVLTENRYSYSFSSSGIYASGEIESFSFPEIFDLPLSGDYFWDVFRPLPQLSDIADPVAIQRDISGQLYQLTWSDSSFTHQLWVDSFRPVIVRELFCNTTGDTIWYREYNRIKKRSGVFIPFFWEIQLGQGEEAYLMQLKFSQLRVNRDLSPADFMISAVPEPDSTEVHLGR